MGAYTGSFFAALGALEIIVLALLVVLGRELRAKAVWLALATAPAAIAPFAPGTTRALGLLLVVLLGLVAAVAGLELRAASPRAPRAEPARIAWPLDDVAVFGASFALAAIVCDRALERHTLSGDEWANTYQADLFAHLRAFGAPRACAGVFRNWWVFDVAGRTFAQYTPGWPLLMAPFQRLGVVWLAGPFTFGLVAVGVARLARRIAREGLVGTHGATERSVRLAGLFAAALASASPLAVLNGASRYPHTMVCACFAWGIESLFAMRDAKGARGRAAWGIALGSSLALGIAARPLDGIALGVAVVSLGLATRRALPRAGVVAAACAFAAWGAFTAVILRLQLGAWLVTAYGMSPIPMRFGPPALADLPTAFPMYRWAPYAWPCAASLAPFGLLLARGRARAVAWALASGALALLAAYAFVEAGRDGTESGYGPRFHLPLVVPAAVASGLVIAWLVERAAEARGRWRSLEGAAAVVVVVALFEATAIVAPTIYPAWRDTLRRDHALARAIAEAKLHHAVVVVHQADLAQEVWDLTQNLPSEADPDTLVLTDWHAEEAFECARRTYGDRRWYVAKGHETVALTPFDPAASGPE